MEFNQFVLDYGNMMVMYRYTYIYMPQIYVYNCNLNTGDTYIHKDF